MLHKNKTDCVLGCVSGKLSCSPHIKIKPQCDFNYREFIHINILYLNVVGIGSFKYCLTIIEHKSHHSLCSSLKLKNDIADDIIVAVAKLEQQCNTHVKIIQCDGAGEFIGKHRKLLKFCKEKGIHLQWFACFEHEQNAVKWPGVWRRKEWAGEGKKEREEREKERKRKVKSKSWERLAAHHKGKPTK